MTLQQHILRVFLRSAQKNSLHSSLCRGVRRYTQPYVVSASRCACCFASLHAFICELVQCRQYLTNAFVNVRVEVCMWQHLWLCRRGRTKEPRDIWHWNTARHAGQASAFAWFYLDFCFVELLNRRLRVCNKSQQEMRVITLCLHASFGITALGLLEMPAPRFEIACTR